MINPLDPAFAHGDPTHGGHPGISTRLWLVGQIDVSVYQPVDTLRKKLGQQPTVDELAAYIAKLKIIEADAILTEMNKEQE